MCRNRGKGAAGNMSGQSGRPWWWTCWSGWSWPNSWTQSQILCCFHSRSHCMGCWKLQRLGSEWHTSNIFHGTGKYDIICACHEAPLPKIPCWLSNKVWTLNLISKMLLILIGSKYSLHHPASKFLLGSVPIQLLPLFLDRVFLHILSCRIKTTTFRSYFFFFTPHYIIHIYIYSYQFVCNDNSKYLLKQCNIWVWTIIM